MADDFCDFGAAAGVDFAVEALDEVNAAAPELPAPAFVADAVIPEGLACKRGEGQLGSIIADETAGGVGVESEEERNKEMMRIPE